MFVVVFDPLGIYERGSEFTSQDFAITLWRGCWPEGMVVRDALKQRRYEVFHDGGEHQFQSLRTLDGEVVLQPANNGWLREMSDAGNPNEA